MAVERDDDQPIITNREGYRLWTGFFILLTIAAIPLGIGYMFGAGAGWLAVAAVSLFVSFSFHKLYKAAAKE